MLPPAMSGYVEAAYPAEAGYDVQGRSPGITRPGGPMSARSARSDSSEDSAAVAVNEVRLRGRLAVTPEPRELPSGDVVATFRLIVDRPAKAVSSSGSKVRVDTIDCAVFRADVRRRILRWQPGDVVEVEGSVRRRFFRAGGAAASRYEVEVANATRVTKVVKSARATIAG